MACRGWSWPVVLVRSEQPARAEFEPQQVEHVADVPQPPVEAWDAR